MKHWTPLFVIFHVALGACPAGLTLDSHGQCRGVHSLNTTYNWHDGVGKKAAALCATRNATLPTIHSEEDNQYWSKKASKNNSEPLLLLGLVCNEAELRMEWVDGTQIDYLPKETSIRLAHITECPVSGHHYSINDRGEWNYYGYNRGTDIYCIHDLPRPEERFVDCHDATCYDIFEAADFATAQETCKEHGATVVSVHSSEQNAFILQLAIRRDLKHGVYLGSHGKVWMDGSKWKYDNFLRGFPNWLDYGHCVAMDTSSNGGGQWVNLNCAERHPFVCKRQEIPPISEFTCDGAATRQGDLIKSPGFPYKSDIPCTFFFSVQKSKRVEVEIMLLEANSCCDFLTIYEGTIGENVIARLTGEMSNKSYVTRTSNSMRLEWNPKDGRNVRGFMATYHAV